MTPAARCWLLVLIFSGNSCTFLIDADRVRCTQDTDCWKFDATFPICRDAVCVSSGLGPKGCALAGGGATSDELANSCSQSSCIPFDNCARPGLCNGEVLPALIEPPAKEPK
jgi:hypothetical protein